MENWKQAALDFINSCSFRDDIDAIFLTGSHVFANADEFSDIDMFIVLRDEVKYRERGNKLVNGFRIEYFANPVRQVIQTIDNDYANASLIDINMILGGILLSEENATSKKIIAYCKDKILSEIPETSDFNVIMGLYSLWDEFDELKRAYTKETQDFTMQYFRFISTVFERYSRYICSPIPGYHKMYRWLTDADYNKKYGLPEYKDLAFLDIIKQAFICSDTGTMYELAQEIYVYVSKKMGGIDIDNFVLHGSCD